MTIDQLKSQLGANRREIERLQGENATIRAKLRSRLEARAVECRTQQAELQTELDRIQVDLHRLFEGT